MASMIVDLPDPVGPTSATRSMLGEVDLGRLAERAEALSLEPQRSRRSLPRRRSSVQLVRRAARRTARRPAGRRRRARRGTRRTAPGVSGLVPATGGAARAAVARTRCGRRPPGRRAASRTSLGEAGACRLVDDHPQPARRRRARPRAAARRACRRTVRSGRPAVSGTAVTSAGAPGSAVDDVDLLGVVALAEVELQRRPAVVDRRRRRRPAGRGGGGRARRRRSSPGTTGR